MAFNNNKLSNTGGTSPAPILYTYITEDTRSTILASGYFNSAYTKLRVNDWIICNVPGDTFTCEVSATGTKSVTVQETGLSRSKTEVKSYNFATRPAASGVAYIGGFWDFPSTDANLTQSSTTQSHGTAGNPYSAHVAIVAGGAGVTDGSDLKLTITGDSITDAGVRTVGDSEILVLDATSSALNQYYESTKRWLGQITLTLSSTGGAAFSYDFNYGFSRYDNVDSRNYTVRGFDINGQANANDSGFDVELVRQQQAGWTYAATGFAPGNGVVTSLSSIYGGVQSISSGESFSFKHTGLNQAITGTNKEGHLVRITTTANNAVSFMNIHIAVDINA